MSYHRHIIGPEMEVAGTRDMLLTPCPHLPNVVKPRLTSPGFLQSHPDLSMPSPAPQPAC